MSSSSFSSEALDDLSLEWGEEEEDVWVCLMMLFGLGEEEKKNEFVSLCCDLTRYTPTSHHTHTQEPTTKSETNSKRCCCPGHLKQSQKTFSPGGLEKNSLYRRVSFFLLSASCQKTRIKEVSVFMASRKMIEFAPPSETASEPSWTQRTRRKKTRLFGRLSPFITSSFWAGGGKREEVGFKFFIFFFLPGWMRLLSLSLSPNFGNWDECAIREWSWRRWRRSWCPFFTARKERRRREECVCHRGAEAATNIPSIIHFTHLIPVGSLSRSWKAPNQPIGSSWLSCLVNTFSMSFR